jgi:hypothetical protein
MTTPTTFALSKNIFVCDVLTFANGVNTTSPQLTQTTENLFGVPSNGYVLPEGVVGYLLGSYELTVGVFTVGSGTQTLVWAGTPQEFASVGLSGGNWELTA